MTDTIGPNLDPPSVLLTQTRLPLYNSSLKQRKLGQLTSSLTTQEVWEAYETILLMVPPLLQMM